MNDTSRRDLLKIAAMGGAATAIGTASAATAAPAASDTQPLVDPTTKYTSEPFKEQPQEWPALQRDMDPVPDCGETSYRGSGRLPAARRW